MLKIATIAHNELKTRIGIYFKKDSLYIRESGNYTVIEETQGWTNFGNMFDICRQLWNDKKWELKMKYVLEWNYTENYKKYRVVTGIHGLEKPKLKIGQYYKNGINVWLLLGNNEDEQIFFRNNSEYGITEYAIVSNTQFRDDTVNGIYWDYAICYCGTMKQVLEILTKKSIYIIGINNNKWEIGGREI